MAPGTPNPIGASSGPATVVLVVAVVVGKTGIELVDVLVVVGPPPEVVEVVVWVVVVVECVVVVGAAVLDDVVLAALVVVVPPLVVVVPPLVVVVPPVDVVPPLVVVVVPPVEVVPPVVVVVVSVEPGALVVVATEVVVVTPLQVQALQRPPHGPRSPSHSSPPSGSQMPSPHMLSVARKGFRTRSAGTANVPFSVAQPSVMRPFTMDLATRPVQCLNFTLTRVPTFVPRILALTGPQPLAVDSIFPTI
jgi:hypothetical protein